MPTDHYYYTRIVASFDEQIVSLFSIGMDRAESPKVERAMLALVTQA